MDKDKVKEYIVCINGGSGVIFQPMDNTCSYILTAKHIFNDIDKYNDEVTIERYDPVKNIFIKLNGIKLKESKNYFPHNTKDISILKVDRLTGAGNLIRLDELGEEYKFSLYGFPETRRLQKNHLDRIREDLNLNISTEKSGGKREAALIDNSTLKELKGQSGGGVFSVLGDYLYLFGIQNKVAGVDTDANEEGKECKGRIEFSPLHNFDEIIKSSNGLLEPLFPRYMKCFSFLQKEVFNLTGGLLDKGIVEKVTDILRKKTEEIGRGDFSPNCIKEHLTEKLLLIHNQKNEILLSKEFWCIWLEFLTILNIVKQKNHVKKDFKDIFSQVRVFYSPTEDDFWLENLDNLALSSYDNLNKNSLVVVASKKPPNNKFYYLDKNKIPQNIAQAKDIYDINNLNISNAFDFPFEKYKFIHIAAFKEEIIINNYQNFENLDVSNIINKLNELYGKLI